MNSYLSQKVKLLVLNNNDYTKLIRVENEQMRLNYNFTFFYWQDLNWQRRQ